MERYAGADVHARSTTFEVLDARGRQICRDVVETNGHALVSYVKAIPGKLHLCIEEGEWSQWLVEILTPHVAEVVVVRQEWRPGSKDDAIDAHGLGERIRTGKLGHVVYKDPRRFTKLREFSRVYTMLTRDVVRTKNRLKSLYRCRGIRCVGQEVYSSEGRARNASLLPVATRRVVDLLGRELDELKEFKKEAEEAMVEESHRHKISRTLETGPGMGRVRVAQMMAVVITPHRFRTKRQFWTYSGFGVVVRSSSDWVRENGQWIRARVPQTRGLNVSHNRTLKNIFKGAATTVIAHSKDHPLRKDYDRMLDSGMKPNLAKLTIARKIAAIMLAMWKKEVRYNRKMHQLTSSA